MSTKITTQVAVVIVVGIVAIVGLIFGLAVWADWSDGAIVGLVTAFSGLLINTVIVVRNQQVQGAKLDAIQEQTNGHLTQRDDNIAALQAENRRKDNVISQLRSTPKQ